MTDATKKPEPTLIDFVNGWPLGNGVGSIHEIGTISDGKALPILGTVSDHSKPQETYDWPKKKYNVYHGADYLGMVEIEDRPGMTKLEKQLESHRDLSLQLGQNINPYPHELHLTEISPSTGRRRGRMF